MNGDLVRRLALMLELREWDGNTGRAARMALDACKDAAFEIRSVLHKRRSVTDEERAQSRIDADAFDLTATECRACGGVLWVTYRLPRGNGSSSGRHADGCVGEELERLAERLEWPTDHLPPRE